MSDHMARGKLLVDMERIPLAQAVGKRLVAAVYENTTLLVFEGDVYVHLGLAGGWEGSTPYVEEMDIGDLGYPYYPTFTRDALIEAGLMTAHWYALADGERTIREKKQQEANEREQLARLKAKFEGG